MGNILLSPYCWPGCDLYTALSGEDGARPGLINISPPGWHLHFQKYLGNPENPSHMPESFSSFVEPMTFRQRLVNTLSYSHDYSILGWLIYPIIFDLGKFFDIPTYLKLIQSVDLLFLGSHFVTHSPQVRTDLIIFFHPFQLMS